jgi:IS1 family transposase
MSCTVWTAVDRNRLRISAFEVRSGDTETFRRLWDRMKHNVLEYVCTDGNPSYSEVLCEDNDIKHVVIKSETCLGDRVKKRIYSLHT